MPNTVNDSGNLAYSCAETVPSLVANCRAARRSLIAWLEQYGSEASEALFNATFHELQWLEMVPRREYQNTPHLQAEHGVHQAKLAAAYAEWKK